MEGMSHQFFARAGLPGQQDGRVDRATRFNLSKASRSAGDRLTPSSSSYRSLAQSNGRALNAAYPVVSGFCCAGGSGHLKQMSAFDQRVSHRR